MIQKIHDYIMKNNLIKEGDTVLVGVSGGADSVCLLCVLTELYKSSNVSLRALHVNHHLRETAKRDEEFVKELCKKLDIPLIVQAVDVKNLVSERGYSTEEAARILRYEAFANAIQDVLPEKAKIAVAHNMNDNAETMLFNLFRGSGLRGLGGIQPKREQIIRPLLKIQRCEIEEYLANKGISFCTDETNLSDDYSRNKIRHNILPLVEEEIHHGAIVRMSETATGLILAEDYISGQVNVMMESCAQVDKLGNARIQINIFEQYHPYMKQRLILHLIGLVAKAQKDISMIHVKEVLNLFHLQVGKKISLPYQCMARREYESVIIEKVTAAEKISMNSSLCIPGETILQNNEIFILNVNEAFSKIKLVCKLYERKDFIGKKEEEKDRKRMLSASQYTKWFDYDKIKFGLCVRGRNAGDYYVVNSSGGTQKIKSFFVNEKIPENRRDKIPLIADDSHILWILGGRTSHEYYVTDATTNLLEITIIPDSIEE